MFFVFTNGVPPVSQTFQDVLDDALYKRRKQQNWLAEESGISAGVISRYRHGNGQPNLRQFIRLCIVLPEMRRWFAAEVTKGKR